MQHVTAADGIAGDHGHDGLGHGANLLLYVEDVEAGDFLFLVDVAAFPSNALIAAGAKRVRAFAGEDDDADVRVVARHVQRGFHLVDGQRAKGVAHFGTIDGDLGDAVFSSFEFDVREFANGGPHWRDCMLRFVQ